MRVRAQHVVHGHRIQPPFPEGLATPVFGMGCFWGAERIFWRTPGVYSTAVGYAGGFTENPTYEETCSGRTGHTEAVLVVFDPAQVSYESLLKVFWEGHDPTQGMRQRPRVPVPLGGLLHRRHPAGAGRGHRQDLRRRAGSLVGVRFVRLLRA